MPKILVVDDKIERTEYLRENLKGSIDDPYEIGYVRNWAELEDKLNNEYYELDMIVFDVDFSDLPDEELIRSDPQDDLDIRNQGYILLKLLRDWEKERNQKHLIKAILVSAVISSIAGREMDIDLYSAETYYYNGDSPEDPGLVNKILRLCPPIDNKKIEEWRGYGIVCGKSRNMYELMYEAGIIAQKNCNVWIDGPTGSGKELMARFIHQQSKRATDLGVILLNLIEEIKQLNEIGPGVFGKPKSLKEKIDVDIAKSIYGFESVGSARNDFESFVNKLEMEDSKKKQIIKELEIFNVDEKKNTIDCLRKVTKLWQKDQNKICSERGLFNFRDINCATFAEENPLLTKLFGAPAGVFTDVSVSPGLFKSASYVYGTLFLDEIGDLSLRAQAALLRVLQENKIERVNSNISERINVRVIAATNKNINELIKSGSFRYDLYMRIAQARIQLPGLKERMDDFDELAAEFLKRKLNEDKERGINSNIKFDENRTINFLKSQNQIWEGNIRALQNVINRAYETAYIEGSHTIDIDHIKRTLQIFDGLVNQEVIKIQKQNNETPNNVLEQLLELIQTKNTVEDNIEDDEEISLDDMKIWLDKAFRRLNMVCTNENLQDLIEHISKLFFIKIITSKPKGSRKYLYRDIAETMEINPRQIYGNKQISTLKIRDLIDSIDIS